jgi:membrane-bound lytic murein transglycosylase A
MRPLSLSDDQEQRIWILTQLQAFSVETPDGEDNGLLTSYYEPVFKGSLSQRDSFNYPIYAPPPSLFASKKLGQAWFSRKEIETSPLLQKELQGQIIAWLEDPLEVMILHVQGSARLQIESPNAPTLEYRVGFAASNDLPYQSMAKWLIDQGLTKDASWAGIKSALQKNPDKEKEAYWSNPRYIFFTLSPLNDPSKGPKGSWGKPLKAHLSIAVDPKSIPLGLPLWLSSEGSTRFQQLVLSEDTGNAINGSIRADYFAGTGAQAGEFANKIKQNLKLWVLLPRNTTP